MADWYKFIFITSCFYINCIEYNKILFCTLVQIDDLSRFVLILLRMRMQELSAGNKNINKGANQ